MLSSNIMIIIIIIIISSSIIIGFSFVPVMKNKGNFGFSIACLFFQYCILQQVLLKVWLKEDILCSFPHGNS